jgi:diguanylate cyclase (GGDEF)-like protein
LEGPYLKELKADRTGLAFGNRRLESEYRLFSAARDRENLRLQLSIGTLLICLLMIMDYYWLDPEFASIAIALRLGVMLPPIVAMYWLTWTRNFKYLMQPTGVIVGLAVGLTSLVIGVFAARYGQPKIFAGYQVIIVFVYFFLGLRVPVACSTSFVLFSAFVVAASLNAANPVAAIYNGVFLLFLNVICATGAYQMERARRQLFLEERILSYRANFDSLTDLPNRRAFDEYLATSWDSALEKHCSLSVLMIDVDQFKSYNDLYGHQAGDHAIREVARILESSLQRPQDFAGRYGGEEFVVLLFDAQKEYVLQLAEQIRERVLGKNIEHARSSAARCVSVSIGLAHVRPHASKRSTTGLVQMADEALYAAKESGRNCVVDADLSVSSTSTGVFKVVQLENQNIAEALGSLPASKARA